MPCTSSRSRSASSGLHRQPAGRAPTGYPNWDELEGVWRNDEWEAYRVLTREEKLQAKREDAKRRYAAQRLDKARQDAIAREQSRDESYGDEHSASRLGRTSAPS